VNPWVTRFSELSHGDDSVLIDEYREKAGVIAVPGAYDFDPLHRRASVKRYLSS